MRPDEKRVERERRQLMPPAAGGRQSTPTVALRLALEARATRLTEPPAAVGRATFVWFPHDLRTSPLVGASMTVCCPLRGIKTSSGLQGETAAVRSARRPSPRREALGNKRRKPPLPASSALQLDIWQAASVPFPRTPIPQPCFC
jgi:hypothetical protein